MRRQPARRWRKGGVKEACKSKNSNLDTLSWTGERPLVTFENQLRSSYGIFLIPKALQPYLVRLRAALEGPARRALWHIGTRWRISMTRTTRASHVRVV